MSERLSYPELESTRTWTELKSSIIDILKYKCKEGISFEGVYYLAFDLYKQDHNKGKFVQESAIKVVKEYLNDYFNNLVINSDLEVLSKKEFLSRIERVNDCLRYSWRWGDCTKDDTTLIDECGKCLDLLFADCQIELIVDIEKKWDQVSFSLNIIINTKYRVIIM